MNTKYAIIDLSQEYKLSDFDSGKIQLYDDIIEATKAALKMDGGDFVCRLITQADIDVPHDADFNDRAENFNDLLGAGAPLYGLWQKSSFDNSKKYEPENGIYSHDFINWCSIFNTAEECFFELLSSCNDGGLNNHNANISVIDLDFDGNGRCIYANMAGIND
jgi:hypothetical protein